MDLSKSDILKKTGEIRVAILWGAGLGDLLILRSFVKALQTKKNIFIYLLTTASHLPQLLEDLYENVTLIQFPTNYGLLFPVIKKWRGKFDLIYLGPFPRWKTRLLGSILGHLQVWDRRHRACPLFLLEQIQADIMELGLREKSFEQFPYGGLPWSKNILAEKEEKEGTPFLVLHISSKDRWETTRWPLPQWQSLVKRILQETELSICIVGVDSEKEMLRSFIHDMKLDAGNRIELCISMPLQEVCSLISASAGVICHNSGILHLATLLKKQTVCITGSSAKFWRPPYPWVKNITSGECNIACNRYKCPIPFFYAKCIRKLPAVKVWQAVQDHLLEIV